MKATTSPGQIGTITLLRVLWRSLFIQAATNYERMQNVGFGFCMIPALRKLHSGEAFRAALKRHLEFFNSHPYMAGALLGASIRLEEQVARGEKQGTDVSNFKRYMMGPMAAIGDSFFWTSLRPFAAAWAIMGVLSGLWWAPLGFLALFNICHLTLRTYGLFVGYRVGEHVCEKIHRLALVRFAERSHYLAAVFLGATTGIFADLSMDSIVAMNDGLEPFFLLSVIFIFLLGLKRGLPMGAMLYGSAFVTIVLILFLNSYYPSF